MARDKRRGKGEGSVFQRKNGVWVAELPMGFDAKGKRKTKTFYGRTKKEATDKMRNAQLDTLHAGSCESQRMTVAQYLDVWVEGRTGLKKTTLVDYRGVIRNHLNPHLGGIKLDKLVPLHVQRMLSDMKASGASPQILKKTYVLLHGALAQAVKLRLIPRNVAANVEKPKAVNKKFPCFTAEQAGRFLEAAKSDRLFALYVVAIVTGLRQGELFALQWGDIDYEAKSLSVKHTLIELGGRLELGEPKSTSSRRHISLPDWVVTTLREHQKRMMKEGHPGPWVFCDTEGNPLRKSNVMRRSYVPLLARAGLPRIRFHDLRHTAATLMFEAGTSPKAVSSRLGHSGIGITMDIYTHVSRSIDQEAADKLGDCLIAAMASVTKPT